MMRMGVWTENLALPAVINECMLQSQDGIIRLFPNTTNLGKASFHDLRAMGAFLVSATWDGKTVSDVKVKSEKGAKARVFDPWKSAGVQVTTAGGTTVAYQVRSGILEFGTSAGETYLLRPASARVTK